MKKSIFICFLLILSSMGLQSQTISKELISNTGSTYTENINLEWSLGEIVLQTYQSNSPATIGFIQGMKIPTSIFDPKLNDKNVIIKPNPSTDYISIESKDENQVIQNIKIYSVDGVHISNTGNVKKQLSIDHLNSGVYILQIYFTDGQSTTKKIIKI